MYQYLDEKQKGVLFKVVVGAFGLLALFLAIRTINSIKEFTYIGKGVYATNIITVNGKGEVFAVPDVATFSFSVTETAKEMSLAQDSASKKMNSVIDTLKSLGVAEKDIKTTNYSSYPKYEYQNSVCPQYAPTSVYDSGSVSAKPYYCPPGKSILTGYEVSQTVTVKIRKTADAGNILAKVGGLNVTNISGIDFVIDDMDKVQAEARDKAIADAKAKAKVLEKSLGVRFSKITSFYENGAYPMYDGAYSMSSKGMGGEVTVTAPQLPTGENKITSNVSISYEIK